MKPNTNTHMMVNPASHSELNSPPWVRIQVRRNDLDADTVVYDAKGSSVGCALVCVDSPQEYRVSK